MPTECFQSARGGARENTRNILGRELRDCLKIASGDAVWAFPTCCPKDFDQAWPMLVGLGQNRSKSASLHQNWPRVPKVGVKIGRNRTRIALTSLKSDVVGPKFQCAKLTFRGRQQDVDPTTKSSRGRPECHCLERGPAGPAGGQNEPDLPEPGADALEASQSAAKPAPHAGAAAGASTTPFYPSSPARTVGSPASRRFLRPSSGGGDAHSDVHMASLGKRHLPMAMMPVALERPPTAERILIRKLPAGCSSRGLGRLPPPYPASSPICLEDAHGESGSCVRWCCGRDMRMNGLIHTHLLRSELRHAPICVARSRALNQECTQLVAVPRRLLPKPLTDVIQWRPCRKPLLRTQPSSPATALLMTPAIEEWNRAQ